MTQIAPPRAAAPVRGGARDPRSGSAALRGPATVSIRYLPSGAACSASPQPERATAVPRRAPAGARGGDVPRHRSSAHARHRCAADDRLSWNVEALAMTERTKDPRAKQWFASLYNNIGGSMTDSDYACAEYSRRRCRHGSARRRRRRARGKSSHAKGCARWGLRRALAIQRALLTENERREKSTASFEEAGRLALACGDDAAARHGSRRPMPAHEIPGSRPRSRSGRAPARSALPNESENDGQFSALRKQNPHPRAAPIRTPFELLIAVVLSAQATDKT